MAVHLAGMLASQIAVHSAGMLVSQMAVHSVEMLELLWTKLMSLLLEGWAGDLVAHWALETAVQSAAQMGAGSVLLLADSAHVWAKQSAQSAHGSGTRCSWAELKVWWTAHALERRSGRLANVSARQLEPTSSPFPWKVALLAAWSGRAFLPIRWKAVGWALASSKSKWTAGVWAPT